MRNALSAVLLLLSAACAAYSVAMQIVSPAFFWGRLFSFSTVWLCLGILFFLLFLFRKKIARKIVSGRRTRAWVALFLSMAAVFAAICAAKLSFITHPRLSDGTERIRYVIVLGGGITKDKKLTAAVSARVKKAAEYLSAHPDAKAIVTGGKGPFAPCPESDVLKEALVSYGIVPERVLAEDRAKDTIQNFEYSARLAAAADGIPISAVLESPVAVVTSDFHIARAEKLAGRIGYQDIYGIAAPTPALFVPNSYFREICACVKLDLRILLTGKPSPPEEETA